LYLRRILKAFSVIRRSDEKFESIIASSPFLPDVVPSLFKKTNRRSVVFFHLIPKRKAHDVRTKLRFLLARVEQKIALLLIGRFFNVVLAGNVTVKDELQKKFPKMNIVIADAGIDTNLIDKSLGNKTIIKDSNLAVFVGRLTVQKGILDIVEIAKNLEVEHPKLKILIIGDGQDKNLLIEKIKHNNLKNVILKGFIDEKSKYEFMSEAKFFIFPSYEEGWGIALAEALYLNCQVFCYELPHYRSIFSTFPNYCKLGDWRGMANSIKNSYSRNVTLEQNKFAAQYEDSKVIKKVLKELQNI